MNEEERPYHDVANLFPLMQGAEYEALKQDIAVNGLREAIVLHPDGSIIDGRNRHRACLETGTPMEFATWDGRGSLVSYVVSLNLHRRHLSAGQRAMISKDVLPMLEEEARERQGARTDLVERIPRSNGMAELWQAEQKRREYGKARDHAGAMFNVNGRYVSDAKRLANEAPDLADDVMAGTVSLPYAMRKLGKRKSEKRRQKRENGHGHHHKTAPLLIVGDAANLQLPDESVDIIITSPPYNLGDGDMPMGGHGRVRRENGIGYDDALPDDRYQRWQLDVLQELYRVARPGASLFYNHKTRTKDGVLYAPLSWLQHVRGWTLRQEIIWDREVTHNHSASLFWPVDERIYWFTKGKPALGKDPIGMPTVWRFHGPQPHTWHPAPFSDELPRRCLQAIGGPGAVVLDPFAGSCTTARVAAAMGYEAIAVDCSRDYLEKARIEHGW